MQFWFTLRQTTPHIAAQVGDQFKINDDLEGLLKYHMSQIVVWSFISFKQL